MTFLLLVLAILATYRLARLISKDYMLEWFRLWLGKKAAGRSFVWLSTAELFHCPYCLGIWIAGFLSLYFAELPFEWCLYTLAIAGGQSLLQEMIDHA